MIISLVSPCATVGAYKLIQGQETFYGTVNLEFDLGFSMNSLTAGVPEPSTLLLLSTGLVGLVGYGRRKRKV